MVFKPFIRGGTIKKKIAEKLVLRNKKETRAGTKKSPTPALKKIHPNP